MVSRKQDAALEYARQLDREFVARPGAQIETLIYEVASELGTSQGIPNPEDGIEKALLDWLSWKEEREYDRWVGLVFDERDRQDSILYVRERSAEAWRAEAVAIMETATNFQDEREAA